MCFYAAVSHVRVARCAKLPVHTKRRRVSGSPITRRRTSCACVFTVLVCAQTNSAHTVRTHTHTLCLLMTSTRCQCYAAPSVYRVRVCACFASFRRQQNTSSPPPPIKQHSRMPACTRNRKKINVLSAGVSSPHHNDFVVCAPCGSRSTV